MRVSYRMQKFTTKQQRFINAYNGNATEAALKAGYSKKTAPFIGAENLKKPKILEAIQKREKKRNSKDIMTREERQAFWSYATLFDVRNIVDDDGRLLKVSDLSESAARYIQGIKTTEKLVVGKDDETVLNRTVEYKLPDRLKASELLGKSNADFIERHMHSIGGKHSDLLNMTEPELDKELEKLESGE